MVELNFKPGDRVKLRLAREEVEGIILESYDKDVVLFKLKSGYNIGILKENILDSQIIEKFKKISKKVNVRKISVPFMTASENMNSEHWITIAEHVKEMLNDSEIKGVIVTHGTDTLHYTSSALSFL